MCLAVTKCVSLQPYPDGWNLPGGGAQRGNVLNLNGAGDPLTPGYPAKGMFLLFLHTAWLYRRWVYLIQTFLLSHRIYLQIRPGGGGGTSQHPRASDWLLWRNPPAEVQLLLFFIIIILFSFLQRCDLKEKNAQLISGRESKLFMLKLSHLHYFQWMWIV